MVTYGDWVAEPSRAFVQRRGPSTQALTGIPAWDNNITRALYNRGGMVDDGSGGLVFRPLAETEAASAAGEVSGVDTIAGTSTPWTDLEIIWAVGYDHNATLGSWAFTYCVLRSVASQGDSQLVLMDPGAHRWRATRLGRLRAENPGVAISAVEFHPDDPYHGAAVNRRLRVRSWVVRSVGHVRERDPDRVGWDGGPMALPDPDPLPTTDPGTLTDVHLLNPRSTSMRDPYTRYWADTEIPDDEQWMLQPFGGWIMSNSSGPDYVATVPPYLVRYGTDQSGPPETHTDPPGFHPTIGQFPPDNETYEVPVGGDDLAYPVLDIDGQDRGMRAYFVSLASRVLTTYSEAGYADWPEFAGTDGIRELWVNAEMEYVCDWTPPRYRAVLADVPRIPHVPPTRLFPRDDALGLSSGRRIWPPPSSQQAGSRFGPGSYT